MTDGGVLEGSLGDVVEVIALAVYTFGHSDKVDFEFLKHSLGDKLAEEVFALRVVDRQGSTDPELAMARWLTAVADCVA